MALLRALSRYKTPFSPSTIRTEQKPSTGRRALFSEVILEDDDDIKGSQNDSPKEESDETDTMDDAVLSGLSRSLALLSAYLHPEHRKFHPCNLQPLLGTIDRLSDGLIADIYDEDIILFHQKEYPHLYILLDNPSSPDFVKCMAYLRRQKTLSFVIDAFVSSLPPRKKKKSKIKKEETNNANADDSDYKSLTLNSGDDVTVAPDKSRGVTNDGTESRDHVSPFAGRSTRAALASLHTSAIPTDSSQTDELRGEESAVAPSLANGDSGDSVRTKEESMLEVPNAYSAVQPEVIVPSRSDPACVLLATRHVVFLFDMLKLSPELVWNILKPLLEDTEVHKVTHNFYDTDYYFLRDQRNTSVKNFYDITYAQKRLESRYKGLNVRDNQYTTQDFRFCFEQYYPTFRTFPSADFVKNEALWKGRYLPSQLVTLTAKHVRDVLKQIVYLDLIKRSQLEIFMKRPLRMTSLKVLTVFLAAPDNYESFKIETEPVKKSDVIAGGNDDDSDFE
ncbi:hypothetical protein RvY_16697 [Ramazzottius varieornatus]|uniref:Uncharacterized protein n=1 Tax=Ramazzottius varieornatus TaxID=947166 RepID=A0A1D1W0K4_RAMVA|nr:hypothetical protein RvY_16697 [Ramazzottius varieornatus]